jgi:hypothetical protein
VPEQFPEISVRFYRKAAGGEPVLECLRKLAKEHRQVIGFDLVRVQFGWRTGDPKPVF